MSATKEYTKDTMITFRSTTRSKNSKGGDRLTLYINQEMVETLISELQKNLENPKGAKLDLHTTKRETEEGQSFDSTFAFVKGVQDLKGSNSKPTKFVKKGTAATYDAEKVAKISREIA